MLQRTQIQLVYHVFRIGNGAIVGMEGQDMQLQWWINLCVSSQVEEGAWHLSSNPQALNLSCCFECVSWPTALGHFTHWEKRLYSLKEYSDALHMDFCKHKHFYTMLLFTCPFWNPKCYTFSWFSWLAFLFSSHLWMLKIENCKTPGNVTDVILIE